MSDSNVITHPEEQQEEAAIADAPPAASDVASSPGRTASGEAVEGEAVPGEAAAGDAVAGETAGGEAGGVDAVEPVAAAEPAQGSAGEASAEEGADAVAKLRRARDERRPVEGRVFGWNPGGFHVVIEGLAAFVPRSEMELEPIADPQSYVDKDFPFRVLKIQGKGKRVVLSRTALLREAQEKEASATRQTLRTGAVVKGRVASLTDFGAFVDLGGGVEGLVHVSEISQKRVAKPADAMQVGQEVEVKVLRVEKSGRRVSLSMKALEPDPWRDVKERFAEGAVVTGKVEKTAAPGAFIELEPGLVGLLPTSEMGLPREAIPARAYPPGKEVRVQVVQVDPRRKRISLAPEGSRVEGTKSDYAAYLKQQSRQSEAKFTPFAAALEKLKRK